MIIEKIDEYSTVSKIVIPIYVYKFKYKDHVYKLHNEIITYTNYSSYSNVYGYITNGFQCGIYLDEIYWDRIIKRYVIDIGKYDNSYNKNSVDVYIDRKVFDTVKDGFMNDFDKYPESFYTYAYIYNSDTESNVKYSLIDNTAYIPVNLRSHFLDDDYDDDD